MINIADSNQPHPEYFVAENMTAGLNILEKAREYAADAHVDLWNFAVEIHELTRVALSVSDLRWLIAKGYIEHATEIASSAAEDRSFDKQGRFRFTPESCFVLTDIGAQFVNSAIVVSTPFESTSERQGANGPTADVVVKSAKMNEGEYGDAPHWDALRRELYVGDILVKRFRVPAHQQELVLEAFQEEKWPARIDDPLPPFTQNNPKRQLHSVISSLNRHQQSNLIQFQGDGTGTGILWKLLR